MASLGCHNSPGQTSCWHASSCSSSSRPEQNLSSPSHSLRLLLLPYPQLRLQLLHCDHSARQNRQLFSSKERKGSSILRGKEVLVHLDKKADCTPPLAHSGQNSFYLHELELCTTDPCSGNLRAHSLHYCTWSGRWKCRNLEIFQRAVEPPAPLCPAQPEPVNWKNGFKHCAIWLIH